VRHAAYEFFDAAWGCRVSDIPRAPAGLKAAGKAVWRGIHEDLGEGWELDARERIVLTAACRQADTNADLEAAIRKAGVEVLGSQGQLRLNAMVTELRQGRIALEKLLASLALPGDESGEALTASERRAQAAANARWARQGRRRHGAA
jgi:hypothetical protein